MNEKIILEEARYQLNFVTEEKESVEIEGFLLESLIELIENKNKEIEELRNYFDTRINIVIDDKLNSKDEIQIATDEEIEKLLKMIRQDLLEDKEK